MCGFVAIVGPGDLTPRSLVETMRDTLEHRGPDGAGFWEHLSEAGGVSFGFRRLAIQDTRSVADQPMVSNEGDCSIVFNGEIYNFLELKRDLISCGRAFRTRSDTEVLLQGYQEWGEHVVDRLNGMFAFAIWDSRKARLLVARDRYGEKPLYMASAKNGKQIFASELKAILIHPDIDDSYDTENFQPQVDGFLMAGNRETIFKDLVQLDPATSMVVSATGKIICQRKYWSGRFHQDESSEQNKSLKTKELYQLLTQSVQDRMRSDVPVAACLSGGLDSSSISELVSTFDKSDNKKSTAFSVVFPHFPIVDESDYINLALEKNELLSVKIEPSSESWIKSTRDMLWHHEALIGGPSNFLEWSLMKRVKDLGFKVILDGQGADELLAGYSFYFQSYQLDLARRSLLGLIRATRLGATRNKALRKASLDYSGSGERFGLTDGRSASWLNECKHDPLEIAWGQAYRLYNLGGVNRYQGHLAANLNLNFFKTSLPVNLFSGDRNSMAHGVEVRYPFLDYDLVDFCMSLSHEHLVSARNSKTILREAMKSRLPSEIINRVDKVGFAAPESLWFFEPHVESWVRERIFDNQALHDVIDRGSLADGFDSFYRKRDGSIPWQWIWRLSCLSELVDMREVGTWKRKVRAPIVEITPSSDVNYVDESFVKSFASNKSERGGNKTAWIISYTPVAKEPRVIRQASTLIKNGWRVVVFGFGFVTKCPDEWNFVDVDLTINDTEHRIWHQLVEVVLKKVKCLKNKATKFFPSKSIEVIEELRDHQSISEYKNRKELILRFYKTAPDFRPDCVFCHDYFTIDPAVAISDRAKVPVFYDCHEYALGQYTHIEGWSKNTLPKLKKLQDYLFGKVDGITVVCEGIGKQIQKDHSLEQPMQVIRSVPFYSEQEFRPAGDIITVLYSGEIYETRGLHLAVESLPRWRSEFRLVFRGYSDQQYVERLLTLADELGVSDRLVIEPPVDFNYIIPKMNKADIGYFVHEDISPQRKFTLPNKFFEYMMAGLAVVVSDLPEMAKIIRAEKNGLLVPTADPVQIAESINSLDPLTINVMKQRSLDAARHLNWQRESLKFSKFLEKNYDRDR